MNELFAREIRESDFIGTLTAWSGRVAADERVEKQATNNSAEQFELGDFKDAFVDVVIDANDAQNSIADQLLKNPRIFGVMQSMMAKMVWKQFQQPRP